MWLHLHTDAFRGNETNPCKAPSSSCLSKGRPCLYPFIQTFRKSSFPNPLKGRPRPPPLRDDAPGGHPFARRWGGHFTPRALVSHHGCAMRRKAFAAKKSSEKNASYLQIQPWLRLLGNIAEKIRVFPHVSLLADVERLKDQRTLKGGVKRSLPCPNRLL